MKTYNFKTNEFNNNNNQFFTDTDYSEILNAIITDDVIKKNDYLFNKNTTESYNNSSSTDLNNLLKAANYLANYKQPNSKKFAYGKTYYLIDGTPIIFYDDEIQIGFDVFKYDDFGIDAFINNLKPSTKKLIIDIYTNANNIKVNIKL